VTYFHVVIGDVFVTHVESINEFYVQTKAQREELNCLTLQLESVGALSPVERDDISIGLLAMRVRLIEHGFLIGLFAVMHMSSLGQLCRVHVEASHGNSTVVRSVDWGIIEVVDEPR